MKVSGNLSPMVQSARYVAPAPVPSRQAATIGRHLAAVDQTLDQVARDRAELSGSLPKLADVAAMSGKSDAFLAAHGRLAGLEALALALQTRARELSAEFDTAKAYEAAAPERAEKAARDARRAAAERHPENAEAVLREVIVDRKRHDPTYWMPNQLLSQALLDVGFDACVRRGAGPSEPAFVITDRQTFDEAVRALADSLARGPGNSENAVLHYFRRAQVQPLHRADQNPISNLRF